MNDYEVVLARGDLESSLIRDGIKIACPDDGTWQFGHYVERLDRDDWTPLIYDADSLETAQKWASDASRDVSGAYRHSRVVRRAIGPWEVVTRG